MMSFSLGVKRKLWYVRTVESDTTEREMNQSAQQVHGSASTLRRKGVMLPFLDHY